MIEYELRLKSLNRAIEFARKDLERYYEKEDRLISTVENDKQAVIRSLGFNNKSNKRDPLYEWGKQMRYNNYKMNMEFLKRHINDLNDMRRRIAEKKEIIRKSYMEIREIEMKMEVEKAKEYRTEREIKINDNNMVIFGD